MMHDEVEQYLKQRKSMVLATQVDGEVRGSTTCFALDEQMNIYFFAFHESVKHRGVVQSPQVSLVVDDGFTIPMRGVEILGTAEVISGPERRRGVQLLTARFPDLKGVWDDPRILVIQVIPDRVRYTDWRHGLGHSREAAMPQRPPSE
jgi:uncharacterized protein YhbP (UPF0306 family)